MSTYRKISKITLRCPRCNHPQQVSLTGDRLLSQVGPPEVAWSTVTCAKCLKNYEFSDEATPQIRIPR